MKLVPWCEVFVNEDAVFCRVSFIEVFESAPGTIHRVPIALAALYRLRIFENVFEARDFADRVAVVFDYNLATGRPAVINFVSLFQFSSFERKFRAPWCEVFVDEDAVFGMANLFEVFETAHGTIHRVSTALAVEANNGGSRLCLAVDWASESVASFQVIACDWRSYVHFVVYNFNKFPLQIFTYPLDAEIWPSRVLLHRVLFILESFNSVF